MVGEFCAAQSVHRRSVPSTLHLSVSTVVADGQTHHPSSLFVIHPHPQATKKAADDAFRAGKVAEALELYTSVLKASDLSTSDRATTIANRAQCHLKLGNHSAAVDDCTACLTISPGNVKALFRR